MNTLFLLQLLPKANIPIKTLIKDLNQDKIDSRPEDDNYYEHTNMRYF